MIRYLLILAACCTCLGCGTVYDCICTCHQNNGNTYDEPFNDQCGNTGVEVSLKLKAEGTCSMSPDDVISGCICQESFPADTCFNVRTATPTKYVPVVDPAFSRR